MRKLIINIRWYFEKRKKLKEFNNAMKSGESVYRCRVSGSIKNPFMFDKNPKKIT